MLSKQLETTAAKTNSHQKLVYMTTTALFAALICVTTAYIFHIPFGTNGGYVHIGDTLIYLAAALLPAPYAMAAGALGGAFADLLTAPVWAPATLIIKMLITIPITNKKDKIVNVHNVIGVVIAGVISFTGYYVAEAILFGSWAALLSSFIGSLMQSGSSAVLFIVVGHALDRMHFKGMLQNKFKL